MLKAVTNAMAVRSPETKLSLAELAGGCLAFSGTDVPLTRAIGVGTAGPVSIDELDAVESFYRSRNSAVRIVVSEHTDTRLREILRSRGYNSDDLCKIGGFRCKRLPPRHCHRTLKLSRRVSARRLPGYEAWPQVSQNKNRR